MCNTWSTSGLKIWGGREHVAAADMLQSTCFSASTSRRKHNSPTCSQPLLRPDPNSPSSCCFDPGKSRKTTRHTTFLP
ncbi:hypothetical protein E2320_014435 [Naja naja]|nr:hypothetical protein E2320_014435 [Naja naja]